MNILITGGLGHIGSFLIPFFLNQGDDVYVIDNMYTQRYPVLFALKDVKQVHFSKVDITDPEADLVSVVQGMDVVVHLAAITDALSSFDNRNETFKVNHQGTERVAKACIRNNVRLIYLSTTSVYGPQDGVVNETSSLNPQTPYAESKLSGENVLYAVEQELLDFVVFRCGTIFGPSLGMRFHTAVNKFIWQAVAGEPITIWAGVADQLRPYLALGDAARAIEFAIERDLFYRDTYNVLNINTSPRVIVDEIERTLGHKLLVEYTMIENINQHSYTVSTQKFLDEGFKYVGSLPQAIKGTVDLLGAMR